MQLRSFRVLKMATIGFKGYKIDLVSAVTDRNVAGMAGPGQRHLRRGLGRETQGKRPGRR